MSERVLIVGSGAREHAIAAALTRSPQQPALVCFGSSTNPGIAALCSDYTTGSLTDAAAVATFAAAQQCTLAVIGPEAPLAAGVADALWHAGIPAFGPRQFLAQVESSKGFTRDLLARYGIAGNPHFRRFTTLDGVREFLAALGDAHVIKDDGLAGGKGVKVFGDHLHTPEESFSFCKELVRAGHPFVIEEKLMGEEFSLLSFTDGTTLAHMPAVQDHKRAFVGDSGPNTGGMGTYTDADGSLPFLRVSDIHRAQQLNEQVIAALHAETGQPYIGVLYGGFMATSDGVRLVEYNARFGDPECLNLLALLETDLLTIVRAATHGRLREMEVRFRPLSSVCKYVVPAGYPEVASAGDILTVPPQLPAGTSLLLGAVDKRDGSIVATGSRTAAVVATAASLPQAEQLCEHTVAQLGGPFWHREDIGTAALIARRVAHMQQLRGKRP